MTRARLSLNGKWMLKYFPEGTLEPRSPEELAALDLIPIEAEVPGNVELDLVRAGVIEDPFIGLNSRELRPYEFYQWWYEREFVVPSDWKGRDFELVFHGLDTIATIWLNGQRIGDTRNMLIRHRFRVTEYLKYGESNHIAVRISSPINAARQYQYEPITWSWEDRGEVLWIRKAGHMYGWDIAPRIVSAGIWRPVEIVERPVNDIESLYYWTHHVGDEKATVGVYYQFRTDTPFLNGLSLRFRGRCGDAEFTLEKPVEFIAGRLLIEVHRPQLWWPKGYGEPNLYTVTCELLRDGRVIAQRVDRIGIRTAELVRTELAGDSGDFHIRINNKRIMVKGSNWVPVDALHSRDAERIPKVVDLFDDLGCNMLRIWGGGVYEDDLLYDLCDEKGIMIWQDFAFACAMFPQKDEFFEQVRAEAQDFIERVRNHPSLVVYCGDNEIDMLLVQDGLQAEYNRISREILPEMVRRCDPYRAYVPSSPYISPEANKYGMNYHHYTPEQHLWGPRDYFKSRFFSENSAHFIGEIGYHGCPNASSIKRFISPDKLWPYHDNDEWRWHSVEHWQKNRRHYDRNELMANQVREYFGMIPDNLEEFALASQICQAEAKKFFIEQARMRKPRCTGILWWNVIDCWPQFSDAVVDYYFAKKLAYHYIKRVQVPVCVMLGELEGWSQPVVVVNDTLEDVHVSYSIRDYDTDEIVSSGSLLIPADGNLVVDRIKGFRGEHKLFIIKWEVDGKEYGNHYCRVYPPVSFEVYRKWLAAIADLPFPFDAAKVAK
ncbi:MAG: glycoside hydrolase family 2 [Firmicutes bacterium]|nr:glycoside hydrolase family 2 [Bacillota bacterium]